MQQPDFFISIKGDYLISTDPSRLDLDLIHRFLSAEAYWAKGIPRELVQKSIRNSLCFGIYAEERQVGFARVITDCATYAYLCDVFILEPYRARGLGKWLLESILHHPELQGLRRWSLLTRDAHGLYAQFGFTPPARPERYMEIVNQQPYTASG